MTARAALLLAALAAPASAQLQGTCVGGACADGYRGCKCDASCCERRLRGRSGAGGASAGGGYSPEMAAMGLMMNFFSGMQAQQSQQQAFAEEQRQLAQTQARIQAAEESARRQAEFEARRDGLAGEMKGAAPDLSKPLEMKTDEPVRRPKPKEDKDALCRRKLPGRRSEDPDARGYLEALAAWDRECGSGLGAPLIAGAASPKVGALIAYESRLKRLFDKAPALTRADVWELNRLFETGESISASLTPAERAQLLGYEEKTVFDPPRTEGPGLLDSIEVARPEAFPRLPALALPDLDPGPRIAAGLRKMDSWRDGFWKAVPKMDMEKELIPKEKLPSFGGGAASTPSEWKGLGRWVREQTDKAERARTRVIAELGGGGVQNEEDYSR